MHNVLATIRWLYFRVRCDTPLTLGRGNYLNRFEFFVKFVNLATASSVFHRKFLHHNKENNGLTTEYLNRISFGQIRGFPMTTRSVGKRVTTGVHDGSPKCFFWLRGGLAALAIALSVANAAAQAPSGTLNATVMDQSGAVLPNANVVLKSEESGAMRHTQSNKDGFFTIVGIPAGTYTVTVQAQASPLGRREALSFTKVM